MTNAIPYPRPTRRDRRISRRRVIVMIVAAIIGTGDRPASSAMAGLAFSWNQLA